MHLQVLDWCPCAAYYSDRGNEGMGHGGPHLHKTMRSAFQSKHHYATFPDEILPPHLVTWLQDLDSSETVGAIKSIWFIVNK